MSRGERFTQSAREIMRAAQEEAVASRTGSIETPHMLLGCIKVRKSLAGHVLEDLKIDYDQVQRYVRAAHPAEPTPPTAYNLSRETRSLLDSAVAIARSRGDQHVGSEHILLAIVKGDDKSIRYLMRQINLEPEVVRNNVERLIQNGSSDGALGSESDLTATQTVRALSPSQPEINARSRVLNMVESGTISAAEGAELLKAMRFAAVPVTGSSGFILLPVDEVNFDDLRQRTLRIVITDRATSAVKADISLPFEQVHAELFRLLGLVYDGSLGSLISLESGADQFQVSLE
jgi:hypothetical protein